MKCSLSSIVAMTHSLLALGCSRAETLADLKPAPVDISASSPTWQNGIAQLVKERCASCHAEKKTEFVPESTPLLDFNIETEFRSVRKRSLSRILDTDNPMPPTYADPLSTDEIEFLKKYLSR